MTRRPRYPSLYQINTRVWLHELGAVLGRPATLDDVDEAFFDRIAADGFDWVWLLGIGQTGDAGRRISRTQPEWREESRHLLPDVTTHDICGSPFAVKAYAVNDDFGGPRALDGFRKPSPSMRSWKPSTNGCSHACGGPRCGTESGGSWTAARPGTAIRRGSASSRARGRCRDGGCSSPRTTVRRRRSATSRLPVRAPRRRSPAPWPVPRPVSVGPSRLRGDYPLRP